MSSFALRVLSEEHYQTSLHYFDTPDHRGTHCRICDALAAFATHEAETTRLIAAIDEADQDMVGCAEKGGDFIDGAEWALMRVRTAITTVLATQDTH